MMIAPDCQPPALSHTGLHHSAVFVFFWLLGIIYQKDKTEKENQMAQPKTERLISKLMDTTKINPKNLITTIFGDAVVVNGGSIWLSSLVKLSSPFGVAEYLSRTTALRLVHDGWFESTRIGKNSYYSFTSKHIRRWHNRSPRVYGPPVRPWKGKWYILLTGSSNLEKKEYANLRQALRFEGIGQIAPHVFISAADTPDEIERVLSDLNIGERVEIMEAKPLAENEPGLSDATVEMAWSIKELEAEYKAFLKAFRPIYQSLESQPDDLDPEFSYVLRMLVVMQYRRISLRDPQLPKPLLPPNWAGLAAFTLYKNIYQAVLVGSQQHLRDVVRTADGPIGEPSDMLYDRFGGLDRTPAKSVSDKAV